LQNYEFSAFGIFFGRGGEQFLAFLFLPIIIVFRFKLLPLVEGATSNEQR